LEVFKNLVLETILAFSLSAIIVILVQLYFTKISLLEVKGQGQMSLKPSHFYTVSRVPTNLQQFISIQQYFAPTAMTESSSLFR